MVSYILYRNIIGGSEMLGAIIGDVIGSVYEWNPIKTKEFELFSENCRLTDDSCMTIAVGCACNNSDLYNEKDFKSTLAWWMRRIGRQYPRAGYGGMFTKWLRSDIMPAYHSFGNGSAMRVSPVAWYAESLEEAEKLAQWSAEVTHDHEEGIKGAQAVAAAIYLARIGKNKDEIKKYVEEKYYVLNFTLDEIRPSYSFDVTCQGSVPEAIVCFLESKDYEDTVRNAVSLGGDCDTQAAIAGSIAEAYYGIPDTLKNKVFTFMDNNIKHYFLGYASNIYKSVGDGKDE